jgi:hypothetical protein
MRRIESWEADGGDAYHRRWIKSLPFLTGGLSSVVGSRLRAI